MFLLTYPWQVHAQRETALIKGLLVDSDNLPFEMAHVKVLGTNVAAVTGADGSFECRVPSGSAFVLEITHIEIQGPHREPIPALQPNQERSITIVMDRGLHLAPIDFEATRGTKGSTFIVIEPAKLSTPNPSGDISTYLKTLAGVNSSNELSNQYSVRGGNFDENLVYINGIEIYRPFLNRSGQAEGLSIVNSHMVSSLAFSAGGFSAYYGDKMSSVLDITYKRPDKSAYLVQADFLGAQAQVEGRSSNYRLGYIIAPRYRTNRYLLNSLDVQGDYNPVFADIQSFVTYRLGLKFSLNWLGYFGSNRYLSVPESQSTKFGTVKDARQLDVYYRGQELIQYQTILNAVQLEFVPHDSALLQFSITHYRANESEQFDVLGQYFMSQLDNEIGSKTFGDPKYLLGVGSYLSHGRNFLLAHIVNVQHRGNVSTQLGTLSWGGSYQTMRVEDNLKEWRYLDSAGYSVPRTSPDLEMSELVQANLNLETQSATAYVMNETILSAPSNTKLNIGVRTNYLNYNGIWLVAPRVSISTEPNRGHNARILRQGGNPAMLKRNLRFKLSAGLYQQQPFYRELRTKWGELLPGVKPQQSLHVVTGTDWNFELWNRKRPFKFSAELYYKYLWNLVPYEIENVRIRYLPQYTAVGYAYGADFHVNGEFIPDLPSWFSFSLMKTRENILGDTYLDSMGQVAQVGWLPRPTDQRYSVNILFQDFLKKNETYRIHLNLAFAHGLPFGPPNYPQFRNAIRIPPYRRVDIGFSKMLYQRATSLSPSKILRLTQYIELSAEIFNAFGIRNTISYLWVKDVENREYAVPSYLTSRRFSLRITVQL
ncbi:MAG: TonB-dependent receptor [Bacteroidetes bacterium]|nr:TonB-dependent receptor [Bacteroidota bacterium]